MGELQELRAQQDQYLGRVRDLGRQLFLAGRGAAIRAEKESSSLWENLVETGDQALGDKAASKPRAVIAGRGLVEKTRALVESAPEKRQALYEAMVSAGRTERGEKAAETNELLLAGLGAVRTVRERGTTLFEELVSEGRQA